VLGRTDDPTHKQKAIYRLTPMGIDLLPVIAALGSWGRKHLPVTKQSAAVALSLEKGGANGLKKLRASLVNAHLASMSLTVERIQQGIQILGDLLSKLRGVVELIVE
jgi:hypothetical protein